MDTRELKRLKDMAKKADEIRKTIKRQLRNKYQHKMETRSRTKERFAMFIDLYIDKAGGTIEDIYAHRASRAEKPTRDRKRGIIDSQGHHVKPYLYFL